MKAIISIACTALVAGTPVFAAEQSQAERIFAEYQRLERAYDSAADLYCDTALIRNVRTYPDGQQRKMELPAPKYKELIRMAMPVAKARGDYNTYSDISFKSEGSNIRVTPSRFSVLKQYTSPVSLLIGACDGSGWAVLEELSESRP